MEFASVTTDKFGTAHFEFVANGVASSFSADVDSVRDASSFSSVVSYTTGNETAMEALDVDVDGLCHLHAEALRAHFGTLDNLLAAL